MSQRRVSLVLTGLSALTIPAFVFMILVAASSGVLPLPWVVDDFWTFTVLVLLLGSVLEFLEKRYVIGRRGIEFGVATIDTRRRRFGFVVMYAPVLVVGVVAVIRRTLSLDATFVVVAMIVAAVGAWMYDGELTEASFRKPPPDVG